MSEAYRATLSVLFWAPDQATIVSKIEEVRTILGDEASILQTIEWYPEGAPPGAPGMPTVVPTLEALDPRSVTVGDPDGTFTLTGTGFDASSIVTFNGQDLPTTFVSETEVSAPFVVPAEAGSYEVTVKTVGGETGPLNLEVNP